MGNELNRINATTKPRLLSIKEIEYVPQQNYSNNRRTNARIKEEYL